MLKLLLGVLGVWGVQLFILDSPQWTFSPYLLMILIYAGINVILTLSLNLINGFTGQFSMGHAGFMALGAYGSACVSLFFQNKDIHFIESPFISSLLFLLSLTVGGLSAACAGFCVGLPSLRLKGDYLAIVTLGFGEIIRVILLNTNSLGGSRGLTNIPALSNFGWVYSFVLICFFVIWRLVYSKQGRPILAVREDDIAAESVGINITSVKTFAFVGSAFFAGIAGGLFAHYLCYLNPDGFDLNRSFEIIIMVVLGGTGSLTGSVLAAFFLTGIKEFLRLVQEWTYLDLRMVLYAVLLIGLMLLKPHGWFGSREPFRSLKE